MTVAEYIVNYLISNGVTDSFGIPGGVILDLIYAMESSGKIKIHLNYNEQASGFSACGNAQTGKRLSIAYATKGPGITNMISAIAESYYESIPVLFITAHFSSQISSGLRCTDDQEINISENVQNITKFCKRVDSIDEMFDALSQAVFCATSGRKGAVLLDFNAKLFARDIAEKVTLKRIQKQYNVNFESIIKKTSEELILAKRPLLLVGDGIKQVGAEKKIRDLVEKLQIPVISSRGAQDLLSGSNYYYGYIGSHGMRYANCIFEKADYVIALGNRMSFPLNSQSFKKALDNKKIMRIEIDQNELYKQIPNTYGVLADVSLFISEWKQNVKSINVHEWILVCEKIKNSLKKFDINQAVLYISEFLKNIDQDDIIISDVGNNEFWLSRAYELVTCKNKVYYSKSFGSLGCSIGKAIGSHYATGKHIICFVGDQGLQFNIQELQTIVRNQLPIWIVVINNNASSMIKDRELSKYGKVIHTTKESGYFALNLKNIALAYGIKYIEYTGAEILTKKEIMIPLLIEIPIDENLELEPNLPKGAHMCEMTPAVNKSIFDYLKNL